MTEAIFDTMGAVLTRWTMGSAAAPGATMWRDELGTEPAEAELRLLALSGQFLGVAVTAEPPATLLVLPDGRVKVAAALPHICADLRRQSLAEAWEAYRRAWRDEPVLAAIRGAIVDPARHAEANKWQLLPVACV